MNLALNSCTSRFFFTFLKQGEGVLKFTNLEITVYYIIHLIKIYNKKSQNGADRFIPNRSTTDMEYASHSMVNSEEDTDNLSTTQVIDNMFHELLHPGLGSRSRSEPCVLGFLKQEPEPVFLTPWSRSRSRSKKNTRSRCRSRLGKKSGAGAT